MSAQAEPSPPRDGGPHDRDLLGRFAGHDLIAALLDERRRDQGREAR